MNAKAKAAWRALRERRFCYRGSITCYLTIVIVCYRFLKTGSNHTPGIATQLIEHGVLRNLWINRICAKFCTISTAGFFGSGGSKKQPTVSKWLSRTLKEEKERKKETAFKLWLACHTQEEIAEAVEVSSIQTISNWCDDFSKKLTDDNLEKWPDFDPPLYNVWKQQTKSNKVDHFGNSEVRCRGCCEAGFQRILTLLRP